MLLTFIGCSTSTWVAMAIFDSTSTYDEDSKAVRRATGPVVFS